MATISYYQKPNSILLDTNSVEFMRRKLSSIGQLRYGRRGDRNYYAMIAIWDEDILDKTKKEHISVKGNSYQGVMTELYNKIFI